MDIKEPIPRTSPLSVNNANIETSEPIDLPAPSFDYKIDFLEALYRRRSSVPRGACSIQQISDLLFHTLALKNEELIGRANLNVHYGTAPSSGGLHAVNAILISSRLPGVFLYDRLEHVLLPLLVKEEEVFAVNRETLPEYWDRSLPFETILFIGDYDLISAAYENAESLLWRDAGVLVQSFCLLSEATNLNCCPVGRIGSSIMSFLPFPKKRFYPLGGVVFGSRYE